MGSRAALFGMLAGVGTVAGIAGAAVVILLAPGWIQKQLEPERQRPSLEDSKLEAAMRKALNPGGEFHREVEESRKRHAELVKRVKELAEKSGLAPGSSVPEHPGHFAVVVRVKSEPAIGKYKHTVIYVRRDKPGVVGVPPTLSKLEDEDDGPAAMRLAFFTSAPLPEAKMSDHSRK
jgi:hypothetical protein